MKNKAIKWLDFINPGNYIGFKPAAKKKTKVQHERMLQESCVTWFRFQHPTIPIVSSVNGTELSGTKEQRIIKWKALEREGAVAGAPDLFVFFPAGGYHGLCVEMKFKDGKQGPKQKEFQAKVEPMGYKYIVIRSLDQFQEEVNNYLHGKTRTDNTMGNGNGQIFDAESCSKSRPYSIADGGC